MLFDWYVVLTETRNKIAYNGHGKGTTRLVDPVATGNNRTYATNRIHLQHAETLRPYLPSSVSIRCRSNWVF